MARYDADVFFSAERERYPLPVECPSCGHTMRPVRKLSVPDRPNTYVCTFCSEPFEIDGPEIRFCRAENNYDRVRAMTLDQMSEFFDSICTASNTSVTPDGWRMWLLTRV